MSVILQPASEADFPAVVDLMNFAFRGNGAVASWNIEADFIDGDRTTLATLRDELAQSPGKDLLLLREEGHGSLQGCVLLEPSAEGTWYLGSLAVDPRLQRTGLGRRLLEAAEQWAADHGATTIRMKVVNVRSALIAWYERRGYLLTGETHPFPYEDHRFGTPCRMDLAFVLLQKSIVYAFGPPPERGWESPVPAGEKQ